ncbi:MAG: aromatic-ring-hydroxylating dioxygenase subunit beta [Gammaproteobacteria bacterium]|nr:aromatic-ring-hydroxylating dioxygenase subunit beta [Gammaproteobacteria bacterium]
MSANSETLLELIDLYNRYISVLDREEWDSWPNFFTDDCEYKVQSRENYEKGLPLSTLWFESKNMLKDRVYAISQTIFHDPYYQRHIISLPHIISDDNDNIEVEVNYAVFRTKRDEFSQVYNVGRYLDKIVRTEEGLKFKSKSCIYDSEMIPNSLIYPI